MNTPKELIQRKKILIKKINEFRKKSNYNSETEESKAYFYIIDNEIKISIISRNKCIFHKFGYFNNEVIIKKLIEQYGKEIIELNQYGILD